MLVIKAEAMNTEPHISLLSKIIEIQSLLTAVHFNFELFLQRVVDELHGLTSATGAIIELIEGKEMVCRAVTGSALGDKGLRIKLKDSISEQCIKHARLLYLKDVDIDGLESSESAQTKAPGSLAVAPLIYNNSPLGVLKVLSNQANAFTELHIKILLLMAGFISSGLAQQLFQQAKELLIRDRDQAIKKLKLIQHQLQHIVHHDSLTGLPNRSLLGDRLKNALAKAKRSEKLLALFYMNIDHFKNINDTLGHDIGDQLLKAFSDRLKQSVRSYDLTVRLGSDEFLLLVEDFDRARDAELLAEKIQQKMKHEFSFEQQAVYITVSIGVAFYRGDAMEPLQLIKQADDAMSLAKKAGGNTFKIQTLYFE